jgi:hypothetical protein
MLPAGLYPDFLPAQSLRREAGSASRRLAGGGAAAPGQENVIPAMSPAVRHSSRIFENATMPGA